MKISLNWLNDYIPINKFDNSEIESKMNMFGFEDTEIKPIFEGLEKVVIGKILKIEKHPNADKLSYCKVDSGFGELNIVCGAPNIKEGDIVPLALVGAVLPNGLKLKRSKIRGIASEGMMCSQKELNYGSDSDGIFILPPDWEVGKNLIDYLNDHIVSFEVKSNRPDLLNHVGLARDLSALLDMPIILPALKVREESSKSIDIEIENPEDCGRYVGKIIEDVEVKESVSFMKFRMNVLDLNTRNNLVDISNYVLFEYGHPVHIFDLDKIEGGKVIIRRARSGEKLLTLDGNTYELTNEMLVIADAVKPIAIAGVIGGEESAVTGTTTNVLIESAYFNPILIRRTAKKLGILTDSSYRFERGTDIKCLDFIANRVADLVSQYAGGTVCVNQDVFPLSVEEERVVSLRTERVNQILGIEIIKNDIISYLKKHQFKLKTEDGDALTFIIPSFRNDIYREIDLIEEVGKLYGYNKIKTTLPRFGMKERIPNPLIKFTTDLRSILIGFGLTETINISIFTEDNLKCYSKPEEEIIIRNPVGQFLNRLRPTLVPGLVRNLKRNKNKGEDVIKLFELGKVFSKSSSGVENEHESLSILLSGGIRDGSWKESNRSSSFFDLKGIVEILCKHLNIKNFKLVSFDSEAYNYIEGDIGFLIYSGEKLLGIGGMLSKSLLKEESIDQSVFICELNVELLRKSSKKLQKFQAYSRFPSIRRDLSLIFNQSVHSQDILDKISY